MHFLLGREETAHQNSKKKNTVGYQMYALYLSLYRILLCSHRSHIWDKAPMRPHVRHNVLYEEEEIEGYSPKTLPKRCDTRPWSHTIPLGSHIHATLVSFHTTWVSYPCHFSFIPYYLGLIAMWPGVLCHIASFHAMQLGYKADHTAKKKKSNATLALPLTHKHVHSINTHLQSPLLPHMHTQIYKPKPSETNQPPSCRRSHH